MNRNDRQTSLNMGFEALKDLASALQVSDKDIAYQGTLAIAFGARGSGNAAAHYEPLRKVINLTKMHGAGSLAHEWWHGLDDYLGTKMGAKGMLSEQPRLYAPFQKLIDTMKYKEATPEQSAALALAQLERSRQNASRWLDSLALDPIKQHGREERKAINAVFDEIVAGLKRDRILTYADTTPPLRAQESTEYLGFKTDSRAVQKGKAALMRVVQFQALIFSGDKRNLAVSVQCCAGGYFKARAFEEA